MTSSILPLRIPLTHVVGIGASAGGLQPLEEFFANMPADSGAAFVVVQHLSRDFESMMDVLLSRHTDMPIHIAEMGMELEANHIYLNSAGQNLILSGGRLMVTELIRSSELHLPIDIFFNSLALDFGPRATAVVLSGAGTDGSRGVRAIHHGLGQVIVQQPESAGFDGMPRSSISSTFADVIATPAEIPARIVQYITEEPAKSGQPLSGNVLSGGVLSGDGDEQPFPRILKLLQNRFQLDFSGYKPVTLERRIERRMGLTHFTTLSQYADHLREDYDELDLLYRDMLVDVTHFFRDEEAFDFVAAEVIPEIVANAPAGDEIRLWVAGCASGEEAYSLGILLLEEMERTEKRCSVRIFATDAHQNSVDRAALGIYGPDSCIGVSPERLERFFSPVKEGYQVSKQLRDLMIFAHQDLLKSPPFTRLDLVSCRNVLIYFEAVAQQQLLSNFHFSLKVGGMLFLGPSEHLGELEEEFDIVDRRWRIFRKLQNVMLPHVHISMPAIKKTTPRSSLFVPAEKVATALDGGVHRAHRPQVGARPIVSDGGRGPANEWMESLLSSLVPAGLVLDNKSDILYIFGDAQQYLHLRLGYGTLNAFELLDGHIVTALRLAIAQILSGQEKVIIDSVQTVTRDGQDATLKISVNSLSATHNRTHRIFVGFEPIELGEAPPPKVIQMGAVPVEQIEQLEYELAVTRATLQTSMEEQESTNEELSAANEELQASNEELSATNEELFTVNTEYQRSINELTALTADMRNLQSSAQIGVLFLDPDLTVRQFTPPAARILGLVNADVGRSIARLTFFNLSIDMAELEEAVDNVLALKIEPERETVELETALWGGRYYAMRVLPYTTEEGVVEGVVLTVIDISDRKTAELALSESEARYRTVVESQTERIIRYKIADFTLTFANPAFCHFQGKTESELLGTSLLTTLPESEHSEFYERVDKLVQENARLSNELAITSPLDGSRGWVHEVTIPIVDEHGEVIEVQSIAIDITERREREMVETVR